MSIKLSEHNDLKMCCTCLNKLGVSGSLRLSARKMEVLKGTKLHWYQREFDRHGSNERGWKVYYRKKFKNKSS